MWDQLSGRDRTRAVACVFGMALGAFAAVFLAVNGYGVRAAVFAFQTVIFASALYAMVKRGSAKPQPRTIATTTVEAQGLEGPPTQTATPTPQPDDQRREKRAQKVVLIVAIIVIAAACVGITGYFLLRQPSSTSQPSTSQPSTTVTPVASAALEGLLLSPAQINTAMGTTGMTVSETYIALDNGRGRLSSEHCEPIWDARDREVYGWGVGVRGQALKEPRDTNTHFVDQSVVSLSSADDARALFADSAQSWPDCANRRFTYSEAGQPDQVWHVGPVSNTNGILSTTKTEEGQNGSTCQRALTVVNNVAIDIETCSSSPSGAAVNIAHQIAAKVPTR
jgi:hypothetical protein